MAILGGLVLSALVALTCISVLGRGLNTFGHSTLLETGAPAVAGWLIGTGVGPLPGDFELVQAGMAFAIFAFLPICQITGGHATVDVFTRSLPHRVNRRLTALWEVVLAAVIVVITWRLGVGLAQIKANGTTSFLLQFPMWWAYGASFAAACVASGVAIYCAATRLRAAPPQDPAS